MAYKRNKRGSYVLGDEGSQFTVTKREYKELQTLVKRANQRRVDVAHRYYDKMSTADVMIGVDYEEYMKLLTNKGFITEKYSTKLLQFKSKEDVKNLLKELRTVTKRGYGSDRVNDVRFKMIEQINENYGSQGEELAKRIEEMADSELISMYLQADREIIEDLFYYDGDDDYIEEQVNKVMTYIDKLTKGSTNKKLSKSKIKQGFREYKARQRNKKSKKTRK